jgi:RNA polymerase sigma-70 factor (ECF subfamily)
LDPWLEDAALARRCLEGDEVAWRELVHAHGRRVFSLCLAAGIRPAEAEDVCQDVMISALRGLRGYRGCRLSTWLYRITRRRIADHLRSAARRDLAAGFPGDATFPEVRTGRQGAGSGPEADPPPLGDELRQQLARLPEPTRSILIAYHVGELPVREIALELRMPENTVKSHLRRGRTLVRARLQEGT